MIFTLLQTEYNSLIIYLLHLTILELYILGIVSTNNSVIILLFRFLFIM